MLVMGIDQSYTKLGYCILDGDSVIAYGTFTSDKTRDVYDRANSAAEFVTSIINKYNIQQVALEGLAFGNMGNATRDLAGLLFVLVTSIRLLCKLVTISIIAPTAVKKLATGSGKAKKDDMINALPVDVLAQFKLTHKKTTGLADIADAFWIAKSIYQTIGHPVE